MPNMKLEEYRWQKSIYVPSIVPGLLRPQSVAVSTASDSVYHFTGHQRRNHKGLAVFQYTLSGQGVFEIDGERSSIGPGKGFCCYVGDPRMAYYYPEWATEDWSFLYVSYVDHTNTTQLLNDRFGFVFDIAISASPIQQLLAYGTVSDMMLEMRAGEAHILVSRLIAMLIDQRQALPTMRTASVLLVRQGLQLIESHLYEPYNAAMLADVLHVSQEHLNRSFQKELGVTPYQKICTSKIMRACELLKNTNRAIGEIATQLGYTPGAHFARLFKRMTGVTPGEYRRGTSSTLRPF
jgi:AraC-like DNA-binding protein